MCELGARLRVHTLATKRELVVIEMFVDEALSGVALQLPEIPNILYGRSAFGYRELLRVQLEFVFHSTRGVN